MQNKELEHKETLELIINHPEIVGIDKKDIAFILQEPIIFKFDHKDYDKSCDIIVGYDHPYNHSELYEIKSDLSYPSEKAKQQLQNTERRFCDRIGYPVERAVILYYPSLRKYTQ